MRTSLSRKSHLHAMIFSTASPQTKKHTAEKHPTKTYPKGHSIPSFRARPWRCVGWLDWGAVTLPGFLLLRGGHPLCPDRFARPRSSQHCTKSPCKLAGRIDAATLAGLGIRNRYGKRKSQLGGAGSNPGVPLFFPGSRSHASGNCRQLGCMMDTQA